MNSYKFIAILLISIFAPNIVKGQISCQNEQGQPVDWFIVYKLPRDTSSSEAKRRQGTAYMYMDGSSGGKWQQSSFGIGDQGQSVSNTLAQYFASKDNEGVFRLLYNDELPDGPVSMTKGHAKGVAAFDSTSGFWLIHSAPKFPSKDSYSYPDTAQKYGQTFLCISLPYSMLEEVGNQLYFNDPYIYDSALPADMAKAIPILVDLIKGKTPRKAPYNRKTILTSTSGTALTSFAKSKKWKQELYADFVAPSFQRILYTETWQNGEGDIGSNCTSAYPVYNIENVALASDIKFSNHDDHSKWAVSDESAVRGNNGDGHWICIGDINRQKGQFHRGGGTVCMQNQGVWKAFRDSMVNYETCAIGSH